MAEFNMAFSDDLDKQIAALDITDDLAKRMLEAAAVPLVDAMKRHCNKHRKTGKMADSVKAAKVKQFRDGGYYTVVRPTGTSTRYVDKAGNVRQRSKSVRNMELLAYLEYGTKKQTKTPIVADAVRESKSRCEAILQQEFDRRTGGAG